jgi:hypothetical protein
MPFAGWLEGEVTHTIVRLLQHLTRNKSCNTNTEKYLQVFWALLKQGMISSKRNLQKPLTKSLNL